MINFALLKLQLLYYGIKGWREPLIVLVMNSFGLVHLAPPVEKVPVQRSIFEHERPRISL